MAKSTGTAVASSPTASQSIEEKDALAKRADTLKKVFTRTREVSERIAMITAAAKLVMADRIAKDPLGAVVDDLEDLDTEVSLLEDRYKGLAAVLSYAKEVSMPARMDAEEVKSFNTEDNRITRTSRIFASMPDKERGMKWLRDNGYGALIVETVNPSSLSAAAKELIETGKELPAEDGDPFSVHYKDGVSITRKKKA